MHGLTDPKQGIVLWDTSACPEAEMRKWMQMHGYDFDQCVHAPVAIFTCNCVPENMLHCATCGVWSFTPADPIFVWQFARDMNQYAAFCAIEWQIRRLVPCANIWTILLEPSTRQPQRIPAFSGDNFAATRTELTMAHLIANP